MIKNSYTAEEYNNVVKQMNNLKRELILLKEENEKTKYINSLLVKREQGKSYEEITRIVAEDSEKRKLEEQLEKRAYYKEIRDYTDMGITDINVIAKFIGKSYASVRRALIDMGLHNKHKEKDFSKMKMNI